MSAVLNKKQNVEGAYVAVLVRNESDISHPLLSSIKNILTKKLGENDNGYVTAYAENYTLTVVILKDTKDKSSGEILEHARSKGGQLTKKVNYEKSDSLYVIRASNSISKDELFSFIEGVSLGNYQFNKYKTEKKQNTLQNIYTDDAEISQEALNELKIIIDATESAKDIINEPAIAFNSVTLGEFVKKWGNELGFKTEVLQKNQIESLRMGGLLGVNMGSTIPPTFSILEYKPQNAKNKKPLIIIGKGVTFDTGGYSLKPAQSMMTMKCDMSGAAAVVGTFNAVVKNKLPVYLIGLIPSTDNRVNSEALVPDDVITISDGTTVEVLNTDAEGRLILADALHYAKKYSPELVIDLATLTGAAAIITGHLGAAIMGTDFTYRTKLIESSNLTHERIAEIPYWKEFAEMIKSDVADIKNIGGPAGGSATAGKFLEHFTNYPWLHLDIAGPAFLKDDIDYRQKGAAAFGVRLLYHFIKNNF